MSNNVEITRSTRKTVVVTTPAKTDVVEVHDPGAAGPPNNLTVGSVTTGNAPAVSITGSSPSQTINFVIPVGGTFIFNQSIASTTWTITHSLGFYPNVTVSDSAGTIIEGQVDYPNVNTVVLTFSSAFAGKAYLS